MKTIYDLFNRTTALGARLGALEVARPVAEAIANLPTRKSSLADIPGAETHPRQASEPAPMVELAALTKLGVAQRSTYFAGFNDGELRVEKELHTLELADVPPTKVIIHGQRTVGQHYDLEPDPTAPHTREKRLLVRERVEDLFWLARRTPLGSYQEACERDRAAEARNEAHARSAPQRTLRKERAAARIRWLNGSTDEPRELLGFDHAAD